jgi:hypothetical protein
MNAYFPPPNGGTGPATHHTCLTNYQYRPEMPHYVKHQTLNKRIEKKILDGYFVVLTGDLNDNHDTYSFKVIMIANQLVNPLHAAFSHHPLFHTKDANSSKRNNVAIDYALYSPLPDNIVLQQVGVCNIKIYED